MEKKPTCFLKRQDLRQTFDAVQAKTFRLSRNSTWTNKRKITETAYNSMKHALKLF